ncbi:MAG: hypothetical protein SH820_15145 [Xanthomonadales bacterium]|nr:hypothetical protein [Xanthomonadales bacterium]
MISMSPKTLTASLTVLVLLLVYTPSADAYLDPSTGSMIVSALVGIFASIALAVKTYWYRLKNLFRRSESSCPAEESSRDN